MGHKTGDAPAACGHHGVAVGFCLFAPIVVVQPAAGPVPVQAGVFHQKLQAIIAGGVDALAPDSGGGGAQPFAQATFFFGKGPDRHAAFHAGAHRVADLAERHRVQAGFPGSVLEDIETLGFGDREPAHHHGQHRVDFQVQPVVVGQRIGARQGDVGIGAAEGEIQRQRGAFEGFRSVFQAGPFGAAVG